MKIYINNLIFKLTGYRIYKVDMSEYSYRQNLYSEIKEVNGKKLDIGSAFGSWSKNNFDNVTTFDKQGNADVVGDAHNMPFKNSEFDTVFCFEVLEHTKNPKLVVSEIKRILNDGGIAYISTPFIYELHGEEYGDFWRFTRQGLIELFKDFHIEIKHFGKNELKPHHYLVKARKML